jgi:hypothetical protein
MKKNYYQILELSPQATPEQIKKAAITLGKKYAAKAQTNQRIRHKLNEIQQAYKVLSHPQLRKYHDEELETEINKPVENSAKHNKLREQIRLKNNKLHEQIWLKYNKLRDFTKKSSLHSKYVDNKKHVYGLIDDETILFYSKPHLLSCVDFAALTLIALSSYVYLNDPYLLKDYLPVVTLWLPSQISSILPEISLWQLGVGILFGMGAAIQLEVLIDKFSTELILTQTRIITKNGFFGHQQTEIKLNSMESVSVKQSLLGRLFNYGSVLITGTGQSKVKLRNITAPHKMSRIIWFYIEKK